MPTIPCESCDQEFSTPWKNAKYCPICRIIRDCDHFDRQKESRPRSCSDCGTEFWPLRGSYRLCYSCSDWLAGNRKNLCNTCHKHNKPAPLMGSSCLACVQSSRKNRAAYVKTLKTRLLEQIVPKAAE